MTRLALERKRLLASFVSLWKNMILDAAEHKRCDFFSREACGKVHRQLLALAVASCTSNEDMRYPRLPGLFVRSLHNQLWPMQL
jgi:hypothetical protein